jgi:uncharacterized protein YebE (UPF0316 family)
MVVKIGHMLNILQAWPISPWVTWAVLPVFIILARLLDYTVMTLRYSSLSGRRRAAVAMMSFLEVAVWLIVAIQVLERFHDPMVIIASSLAFAVGTYAGITLQESFSGGSVMIRITTAKPADGLMLSLASLGVGMTIFEARGSTGSVNQLVIGVNRKMLPQVLAVVERYFSRAFFTIEEVAYVSQGARLGSRKISRARTSRKR